MLVVVVADVDVAVLAEAPTVAGLVVDVGTVVAVAAAGLVIELDDAEVAYTGAVRADNVIHLLN